MSEVHTEENKQPTKETDLASAAKMVYLTPEETTFTETEGQMLAVQVGKESYPTVYLHSSFPHTNNRIYISVRTEDNKEIGMIQSLDDFSTDTVQLLERHINIRYFAPEITQINAISDEFGYSYWDTETTAGNCYFTVRTGRGNVTAVTESKLLVTDVDGNRFVIPDVDSLTEKEYRMIEMLMA